MSRRWVIIATDRSKRPQTPLKSLENGGPASCPFCPGHEAETPPEVLAVRAAGGARDGPDWTTRIFPDAHPLLSPEHPIARSAAGMYDRMGGFGLHEIVVESRSHDKTLATLPEHDIEICLRLVRDRILEIRSEHREVLHILLVKNVGQEAGGNHLIRHSHMHLLGLPIVPKRVLDEIRGAQLYYRFRSRCVFCDVARLELGSGERVYADNANFAAFVPFAARFPFETHILPRRHMNHFEEMTGEEIRDLASILRDTVGRISTALQNPAFNLIFHISPYEDRHREYYHWHVEIMPRVTRLAGFEWGSGFYINPTSPEVAAAFLRNLGKQQGV